MPSRVRGCGWESRYKLGELFITLPVDLWPRPKPRFSLRSSGLLSRVHLSANRHHTKPYKKTFKFNEMESIKQNNTEIQQKTKPN